MSIALSWLLLPPEVGVNRHGLTIKRGVSSVITEDRPFSNLCSHIYFIRRLVTIQIVVTKYLAIKFVFAVY